MSTVSCYRGAGSYLPFWRWVQMHQRLQQLTGSSGLGKSLTASDVAAALSVPLAIASEHLLAAESHGALCRDDGPEGLRFYRNFFADDWSPIC